MLLPGMESIRVAPNLILCQQQKWDESWGCGYRNLQTIVQAILHSEVIRERSGLSRVPRITDIQWDIERAWEAGFDRLDWNNSILGSSAWIGPQEVVTYLRVCNLLHSSRILLLSLSYFNEDPIFPTYVHVYS